MQLLSPFPLVNKILNLSINKKNLILKKNEGSSHFSSELESQPLVITALKDYKDTVSPQSCFSDFSQVMHTINKILNSLDGSFTSLNVELETQEASLNSLSTARSDSSKDLQKIY